MTQADKREIDERGWRKVNGDTRGKAAGMFPRWVHVLHTACQSEERGAVWEGQLAAVTRDVEAVKRGISEMVRLEMVGMEAQLVELRCNLNATTDQMAGLVGGSMMGTILDGSGQLGGLREEVLSMRQSSSLLVEDVMKWLKEEESTIR